MAFFWNTGDEHDEYGHISEDKLGRIQNVDKRLSRHEHILKKIPKEEQVVSYSQGDYTIISWGSCIGPILDAIEMLKNENINVGLLEIKLLEPFPSEIVKSYIKDAKKIIDVEANATGQLGQLFKLNVLREIDNYILKYSGRAMTSTEIYDSLKKIIQNKAEKKEVLSHGA